MKQDTQSQCSGTTQRDGVGREVGGGSGWGDICAPMAMYGKKHHNIVLNVKVAQSCLTLCDPMDYTVYGILQTRILEWVAFPFSRGSSQPRDPTQVSRIAGGFCIVL